MIDPPERRSKTFAVVVEGHFFDSEDELIKVEKRQVQYLKTEEPVKDPYNLPAAKIGAKSQKTGIKYDWIE